MSPKNSVVESWIVNWSPEASLEGKSRRWTTDGRATRPVLQRGFLKCERGAGAALAGPGLWQTSGVEAIRTGDYMGFGICRTIALCAAPGRTAGSQGMYMPVGPGANLLLLLPDRW